MQTLITLCWNANKRSWISEKLEGSRSSPEVLYSHEWSFSFPSVRWRIAPLADGLRSHAKVTWIPANTDILKVTSGCYPRTVWVEMLFQLTVSSNLIWKITQGWAVWRKLALRRAHPISQSSHCDLFPTCFSDWYFGWWPLRLFLILFACNDMLNSDGFVVRQNPDFWGRPTRISQLCNKVKSELLFYRK